MTNYFTEYQLKKIAINTDITSVFGVFLMSILGYSTAYSQNIQTDRPDQTECPFIVPKKNFQLECGINYEKVNASEINYVYPTALWKYGINEKFELRLITEIIQHRQDNLTNRGISPVMIGFKTSLTKEHGIIPTMAFIAHLSLPNFASHHFKSTYFAPNFRFTMQHTLSDKISLGYNLGAQWDGESPNPSFIYTLVTGFTLTKKLGCYIEAYGFIAQYSLPDHRADGGFTYCITQNIQFDISGGLGITPTAPRYYSSLGISVRFPN